MLRSGLPGCRQGRACACGALTKDGALACVKCVARGRWSRRKAWRGFRDSLI
jgi:hypothetical protein